MTALYAIEPAVDDAFIVHRYVVRFLDHQGLTFNPGEYVEGFTSIAWTAVLILFGYLGLQPPAAALLVNYLSILIAGVLLTWLLRLLNARPSMRTVALLLLATSFSYFRVIYLGLEFGLFIVLLLLFFGTFLIGLGLIVRASLLVAASSGVLGALLFAVRPEALVFFPTAVLLSMSLSTTRSHVRPKAILTSGTAFLVTLLPVVLFRLSYYGELLPNSVIAKSQTLSSLMDSIADPTKREWFYDGWDYLVQGYAENPVFLGALASALGLLVLGKRRFEVLLVLSFIFLHHGVVLQNGGDWMPAHRFLVLYAPLFIFVLCLAGNELLTVSRVAGVVFLGAVFLLQFWSNWSYFELESPIEKWYRKDKHHLYQAAGETLANVWKEGDVLLAEAIGRIGYAAPEVPIQDPAGLTDKTLARDPSARRSVYGRGNWRYSLARNPAVIVLHHWPHQRSWSSISPGYPEDYAFYCIPPLPNARDGEWLYAIVRRDRIDPYGTAIASLNARSVQYSDLERLTGQREKVCGFTEKAGE